jgi:hypothetical protein
MEPTPSEAAASLATAHALRRHVDRNTPYESRSFFGWAIFVLAMLPPFAVVNPNIWGPIVFVLAIAGGVTTTRYFQRRISRVLPSGGGRSWIVWIPWAAWYGALIAMGNLLQSRSGFIWPVAAVAAAVPLLVVGVHLARQGR